MDQLSALLASRKRDVLTGWTAVAVLALTTVETVLDGAFDWAFVALVVAMVILAPAVVFRDRRAMPPWELVVLALAPLLWQAVLGQTFRTEIPTYLAVAALALLASTELHQFTSVRMNRPFAIVLVVLTTLAVAGVWNVLQWTADVFFGTAFVLNGRSQDAINADVLVEFVSASCAGIGAGVLFDRFVRSRDADRADRRGAGRRRTRRHAPDRPRRRLRDRRGRSAADRRERRRARCLRDRDAPLGAEKTPST